MPILAELDDPGKLFRIGGSSVDVRLPVIVEQTFLCQPTVIPGTPDEKIRFKRGQILEIFRMKAGKQSLRMIGAQQREVWAERITPVVAHTREISSTAMV